MENIDKFLNVIKNNKWIHYTIIIIIGIIISIPLYKIQISDTHDGALHFLRMFGTVNTLKLGQFPPLMAPYYCNGGGYAMNLFYNPLVTYIPLLIKLFTPTYMLTLKIFAALCIILSGITMYQFVLNVTNKRTIALFSAIIYILSPYKLGDIYRRFAIGEFASFIFIPVLFTGLYSLFNQDGKKHYLIAIGTIGLLLTHTVTTFYMGIISAVYVLCNIKKLKEKIVCKKILINIIFILLVTLFFIAPMMEAKMSADYVIFDNTIMATNGKHVFSKTLTLDKFFEERVIKFEDTVVCIGIPIFILLCLTVFIYKKVDIKYKEFYLISIFFSIITVYMCTKYCPWSIFPDFLCKLQYPWRLLGFFNFFSSFIVGVNIYLLLKYFVKADWIRLLIAIVLIVFIIIYTLPIILQFETKNPKLDEIYENYIINKLYVNHMYINRDYLTVKALDQQDDYLQERDYAKIYILDGNAQISFFERHELDIVANIENCKKGTILEFPFFYYPGYKITIEENGVVEELDIQESENGFISTIIDKDIENAEIKCEYVGTWITYTSYIISLTALIAFIIYIIIYDKKLKNNEKENLNE